jgi:hypothetical protein
VQRPVEVANFVETDRYIKRWPTANPTFAEAPFETQTPNDDGQGEYDVPVRVVPI